MKDAKPISSKSRKRPSIAKDISDDGAKASTTKTTFEKSRVTKGGAKSFPAKKVVVNKPLVDCKKCRALSHQFKKLRLSHPNYWNQPVPATGHPDNRLLIVGLAPGMHGANRTGVPFEGDASGQLMFKALEAEKLIERVKITNAVKCLPIKNLPTGKEVGNCNGYLKAELDDIKDKGGTVLALGGVSHRAIIKALGLKQADYPFGHAAIHLLEPFALIDTYHCSRYNTQTGRLTYEMFLDVVRTAGNMAYP